MADDTLQRFIIAQKRDYATAFAEIRNGRKRSHWMWYIFPQLAGLGPSETSQYYAIRDHTEAGRYLRHPVLGRRLLKISRELLNLSTNDATTVFGSPDNLKLQSCMTLFSVLSDSDPIFQAVLDKYFEGVPDSQTLRLLGNE